MNELHTAADDGCIVRTLAFLSRGLIDVNQGTPEGWTPLMFAAQSGHSRVVELLLKRGAIVSIVYDEGGGILPRTYRVNKDTWL